MNPWLTCPDCGAMLVVKGQLMLLRLQDGLAVIGMIDHDCAEVEKNMVMS